MKKTKTPVKSKSVTKNEKAIATMRKSISEFTDDYMSVRIQPSMQKRTKIN